MNRRSYSQYYHSEVEKPETPKEYKEEAYINGGLTSEPIEESKGVMDRHTEGIVVNCEMVNVRVKPDAKAPIASVILKDEKVYVNIDKSTDDYYAVTTGLNIDGFIKKDFLKV